MIIQQQQQQQQRRRKRLSFMRILVASITILLLQVSSNIVLGLLTDNEVNESIEALYELQTLTSNHIPKYEDASYISSVFPHEIYSPIIQIQFCLQPILYEGLPYKDKPITKVFAWLSLPCDDDSTTTEVPGVVLVHGGGGTAWIDWCKRWSKRGYASISIAVEGQTDVLMTSKEHIVLEGAKQLDLKWKFIDEQYRGPYNIPHEPYRDSSTEKIQNQWMYHAIGDTMLAHSLMKSFSSIKSNQIGLHGVSWGSIIGLTTLPLYKEFAFYIDQYGCGSLTSDTSNRSILGEKLKRRPDNKEAYDKIWDPTLRLSNIENTPILFLGAPGDIYFPMENVMHTYHALSDTNIFTTSFQIPNLIHHHNVWNDGNEAYVFADSVLESMDNKSKGSSEENVYYNYNNDSHDDTLQHDLFPFWIGQIGIHHGSNIDNNNIDEIPKTMIDEDYINLSDDKDDKNNYMEVIFSSTKHLLDAELVYTYDKSFGPKHQLLGQITSRIWQSHTCGLIQQRCDNSYSYDVQKCIWRVGGLIPHDAQSWYFLVHAEEENGNENVNENSTELLLASSRIFNRLNQDELE